MIPTTDTAGQRTLHALLNEIGLIVEDEVRVGRYSLDCYVRDYHLGFEFDGPTHRGWKSEARDKARDAWLLEHAGLPLFRVTERGLRDQDIELAITDFVMQHAESVQARLELGVKWLAD